ncbi:827_t:CDS:1, partial [Ambispora gerdemannii]
QTTLQELNKQKDNIDLDEHIDEQIITAYTISEKGYQFRSQRIQKLRNGKRDPRYLPEGEY